MDRFIPEDGIVGKLSGAEAAYIDSLLKHSASHNKIPVLTCTRSLGRARAIKETYPCTAILQYRNIFHQWASASRLFMHGNTYFLNAINDIIKRSRHDRFLRLVDDAFATRTISVDDEGMLSVFILFHLYVYSHAFDFCDFSVDVNQIATSRDYRGHIETILSNLLLSSIDLSDVKNDFQTSSVHVSSPVRFKDTIDQFAKLVCPADASDECFTFARRIKEQCIEEWERHEFYTRGARAYFSIKETKSAAEIRKKMAQLAEAQEYRVAAERERDALARRLNGTTAERDGLTAHIAGITAERDGLSAQVAAVTAERDGLTAHVAAVTAERDGLTAHVAAVTAERDGLTAHVAAVTAERDGLSAQVAAVTAERDGLSAQVAGMTTERDSLSAQVMAVTAERDGLTAHVAAVTAERDGLSAQVATMTAERDGLAAHAAATIAERDSLSAQVTAVTLERDGLCAQVAALTAERDGLSTQVTAVTTERDGLAAHAAATIAERDGLSAQVAALTTERDGFSAQVATMTAELGDIAKRLSTLADERDSLASDVANAGTERQGLSERLKAMTKERDTLLERQRKARPFWVSGLRG